MITQTARWFFEGGHFCQKLSPAAAQIDGRKLLRDFERARNHGSPPRENVSPLSGTVSEADTVSLRTTTRGSRQLKQTGG